MRSLCIPNIEIFYWDLIAMIKGGLSDFPLGKMRTVKGKNNNKKKKGGKSASN